MSKIQVLACVVGYEDHTAVAAVVDAIRDQGGEGISLTVLVADNSESQSGRQACQQVAESRGARYVHLENLGVSGGYDHAARIAISEGFCYLWLWDQDSEPTPHILRPLVEAFSLGHRDDKVGVVMPKLQDPSGVDQHWIMDCPPYQLHQMHTRRYPMDWLLAGVAKTTFFVNSGALVSVEMIREIGAPSVDFFMDFVDFEYSSRLVRAGYIALVQAGAVVNHKVGTPKRFKFLWKSGWARNYLPFRYYYQAKNEMLLIYASGQSVRLFGPTVLRILVRPVKIAFDEKDVVRKIVAHFIGFFHGILGRKGRTHASWMVRHS